MTPADIEEVIANIGERLSHRYPVIEGDVVQCSPAFDAHEVAILYREYTSSLQRIAEMERVVGKLGLTADGARVVCDDVVFGVDVNGEVQQGKTVRIKGTWHGEFVCLSGGGTYRHRRIEGCYSTRELALSAGKDVEHG